MIWRGVIKFASIAYIIHKNQNAKRIKKTK